jgi:zinc transport system substrate-binding protein
VAGVRALPILVVALLVAGCGGTSGSDRRPTVVAAFYPLAWGAQRIAGPGVRVVNLTPAGAEPHDLELTPRDIEAIDDAKLVLYLGHGFQPAVEKAVEDRPGPSLDLLEGQRLAAGAGEERGAVDPHVWLDPVRFARIAVAIGAALHREQAAASLAAQLRRLDLRFRAGLRDCARHELVTSHAAFGYLAERYGLRQVALTGLSPEAEPSPRDVEALVDEVRKSAATTVFFETLVSSRLAQTVAREAGATTAVLDPLEGLTDNEIAAGDDYPSVMRRNLSTLRRALECR